MTTHRSAGFFLSVSAAVLAFGCGGASGGDAFAHIFADNESSQVDEVLRRLAGAPEAQEDALVVGLTETELFAFDPRAGRELWRQPVQEPRGEAHIAGPLVLLHEGARVIARRAADGVRAFEVPDERLSLVGAGGQGAQSAFVLSTTGGVGAASQLYLTSGAAISHRYEVELPLGSPTVAAGMAFVPWGNQNVTVIDLTTGAELARLRTLAGVVSHARFAGGAVFFGQSGIGRITRSMGANDPAQIGWVQPDVSSLPGSPPLFRSAYNPPASARSATHRIELLWAPTGSDGSVSFTDGQLYLTFYRLVFALSADDLSVRWVQQVQADAVGGAARAGGVVVADAAGGLRYFDARTGTERWTASTGVEPTVVSMRIGDFEPSGVSGEALGSLAEQLLSAAQSRDARLVPGRAFAVRALAAIPDEAVTEHIVVLCDDRALPDPLRAASCEALAQRTTGIRAVTAALQRRASFLADTTTPPVGALAAAAARMNGREAVPLLVAHLQDPDTELADIPQLAASLAQLGDRGAVEPLTQYLWLYHSDGDAAELAVALGAVARALLALDGPPGRESLAEVLDAPFTSVAARAAMQEAAQAFDEAAAGVGGGQQ